MVFSRVTLLYLFFSFQVFAADSLVLTVGIWDGPEAGSSHPLNKAYVLDNHGHVSITDSRGHVDISRHQGELFLSSGNDQLHFEDTPEKFPLGNKESLDDEFDVSAIAPQEYLIPRLFLQQTMDELYRDYTIALPYLLKVNPFFGKGCNAGWDGSGLIFYTAEKDCISIGFVRDVVIHEFAHALLEMTAGRKVDSDFNEAFADALMALMTNDTVFAGGLYPGKVFTYIRDIKEAQPWPDGWRGQYSGSMIFSNMVFENYRALETKLGRAESKKISMEALFALFSTFGQITSAPSMLEGASRAYAEILSSMVAQDYSCIPEIHLQEAGFTNTTVECPAIGNEEITGEQWELQAQTNLEFPLDMVSPQKYTFSFDLERILEEYNIISAALELKVDHYFPDDLRIAYGEHALIPLYKGIEELQIPDSLNLDANSLKVGHGKITIWDSSNDLDGQLLEAPVLKLILKEKNQEN